MKWQPLGKYVLVRLHTKGSQLLLEGDVQYNGLGEVLEVGPEVEHVQVGDTVLLNGPQGLIAHVELGEHVALVAAPFVLAVQVAEPVVES